MANSWVTFERSVAVSCFDRDIDDSADRLITRNIGNCVATAATLVSKSLVLRETMWRRYDAILNIGLFDVCASGSKLFPRILVLIISDNSETGWLEWVCSAYSAELI